jgi:ABC-2 type transport system ATP-binding protein
MVEADMLCERIGIIDYGKIVALDTPANLKKIVSGTDATVVEVEIQNLQPSMLSATKSLEMVQSLVQEDGTHIKIHAKGKEAFDRIIDTLRDKGAKISMVKNIQPSLEDVFLHLTGRQVREKTAENNDQSRRGRGGWRQQRAARVR